jgi:hypothetical protein
MGVSSFPVNGLALFQQLWVENLRLVVPSHVGTEAGGQVARDWSGDS